MTWVTCKSLSDPSHTKIEGGNSLFEKQHKVIGSVHQQWEEGEKYLFIMCTGWWITHIFSPYLANSSLYWTYHLPVTETQRFTEVKWQFNCDHTTFLNLHLNHSLTASDEFLTKKKGPRSEYFSAELESSPSRSTAMHFNLPSHYSKWKWKLEPEAFIFEQREGKQIMNVQNIISITLPLFSY